VLFVLIYAKKTVFFHVKLLNEWVPITFLFSLILFSSLHALKLVSVPTLVVIRSCSSLTTAIADFIYRGVRISRVGLSYLFGILLCSVLYSFEDIQFHSVGYSWLVLNLISTTFYQIIIKEVIEKHDLNTMTISFYNNLLLFISMGSLALIKKENFEFKSLERSVYCAICISILWGLCLSLSSSNLNRVLSPTSVMVANNVNKFVLILYSEIFIEVSQSPRSIIICFTVLFLGYLYSSHQFSPSCSREQSKLKRNARRDLVRLLFMMIILYSTSVRLNISAPFSSSALEEVKLDQIQHFGIMLVKDERQMLKSWIDAHLEDFDYIFMIDGSTSNSTKQLIFHYKNVFYYHEKELELKSYTDSELRRAGFMKLTDKFGFNNWITFAYCDEFYYHDPRKIISIAQSSEVDGIEWYALHVLPHPTEYETFVRNRAAPVVQIFRHYHHYANGAFRELRTFKSNINIEFDTTWSSSYPRGLTKIWDRHPAYLHFKVKEINPTNYDTSGHHIHTFESARNALRKHGVTNGEKMHRFGKNLPHTGLSWPIKSEKDFFVRSYIGKPKYTKCSKFNGTLVSYLDDFGSSVRHRTPIPL